MFILSLLLYLLSDSKQTCLNSRFFYEFLILIDDCYRMQDARVRNPVRDDVTRVIVWGGVT